MVIRKILEVFIVNVFDIEFFLYFYFMENENLEGKLYFVGNLIKGYNGLIISIWYACFYR